MAERAADSERLALHNEVALENLSLADALAQRYRGRGVPDEDLQQIARLGLLKAIERYDPGHGGNFAGFAKPTILGELRRYFRDKAWAVRPYRRIQDLQPQITSLCRETVQRTGQEPSVDEIADGLDADVHEINEALAAQGCFTPSSLDVIVVDGLALPLSDTLGGDDPAFDRAEAAKLVSEACGALPDRARRIIYLRFFLEWTQQEIADELHVSQMQVSRLITGILHRLRSQIGPLDEAPEPASPLTY